jgi:hypothetical protein
MNQRLTDALRFVQHEAKLRFCEAGLSCRVIQALETKSLWAAAKYSGHSSVARLSPYQHGRRMGECEALMSNIQTGRQFVAELQ